MQISMLPNLATRLLTGAATLALAVTVAAPADASSKLDSRLLLAPAEQR